MSLHIPSRHLRIGDTLRFPLRQLGESAVYRHRWEITAFRRDGVDVRRRADGLTRTVSVFWADRYCLDRRETIADDASDARAAHRRAGLARIRASRYAAWHADRQTDPALPGFYVSARKGAAYRLLIGPFRSLMSAEQLRRYAWYIVQRDYADPYMEIAIGTCRTETSARAGLFNAEIFDRAPDWRYV